MNVPQAYWRLNIGEVFRGHLLSGKDTACPSNAAVRAVGEILGTCATDREREFVEWIAAEIATAMIASGADWTRKICEERDQTFCGIGGAK